MLLNLFKRGVEHHSIFRRFFVVVQKHAPVITGHIVGKYCGLRTSANHLLVPIGAGTTLPIILTALGFILGMPRNWALFSCSMSKQTLVAVAASAGILPLRANIRLEQ